MLPEVSQIPLSARPFYCSNCNGFAITFYGFTDPAPLGSPIGIGMGFFDERRAMYRCGECESIFMADGLPDNLDPGRWKDGAVARE